MNYLIFGDLHITQNSLKECREILNEILMLCNKYSVTHVIDLGDTYDNLKPTSQELDLFSNFIRELNRPITIIAANSHESETEQISIINHFGVLNPMVKVVKEIKQGNHLYCGHFFLKESSINYGAKLSKEDLKDYIYVFLGHQHNYEVIKPNICHLGSCRYVNFEEVKNKHKIVALITNYGQESEQVHFLKLKSPIPMISLELDKNSNLGGYNEVVEGEFETPRAKESGSLGVFKGVSELSSYLDQLDPKTKVKVKIKDFESFRELLPLIHRYESKFYLFRYVTDFEVVSVDREKLQSTEIKSFKESLSNYLKNNKIDPAITEILQKEIE